MYEGKIKTGVGGGKKSPENQRLSWQKSTFKIIRNNIFFGIVELS